MENKSKIVYIFIGLNILKEVWEAFSNEPIITGIFKMFNLDSASDAANFISKYWLLIISVGLLLYITLPQLWQKIIGLREIGNKRFVNQIVVLDGCKYIECIFENCTIKWSGGKYEVINAKFIGSYYFQFHNKTAIETLQLLKSLNFLQPGFSDNLQIFTSKDDLNNIVSDYKQPAPQKTRKRVKKR